MTGRLDESHHITFVIGVLCALRVSKGMAIRALYAPIVVVRVESEWQGDARRNGRRCHCSESNAASEASRD